MPGYAVIFLDICQRIMNACTIQSSLAVELSNAFIAS